MMIIDHFYELEFEVMRGLVYAIIVSFLTICFFLNEYKWKQVNPEGFKKTDTEAALIIESKKEIKMINELQLIAERDSSGNMKQVAGNTKENFDYLNTASKTTNN